MNSSPITDLKLRPMSIRYHNNGAEVFSKAKRKGMKYALSDLPQDIAKQPS